MLIYRNNYLLDPLTRPKRPKNMKMMLKQIKFLQKNLAIQKYGTLKMAILNASGLMAK